MRDNAEPAKEVIPEAKPVQHDQIRYYTHRIIVAGTRKFNDYELFTKEVKDYLLDLKAETADIVFISGAAASGADALIIRFAKEFGYAWSEHHPDWNDIKTEGAIVKFNGRGKPYNALAGFWRNQDMAEYGTRLLTFYDGVSSGTRDMIERMKYLKRPITTLIIPLDIKED